MAIDPSIPLQVHTPQPYNVLQSLGDVMAIKNAQLAQQQHIRAAEEQDRQLAAQKALDDAWKSLGPKPDPNALAQRLADAGYGHLVPGVLKSFSEMDKSAAEVAKTRADTRKTQTEIQAAERDAYGAAAAAIKPYLSGEDKGLSAAKTAIENLVGSGVMKPEDGQAQWDQIRANPDELPKLVDSLIAGSKTYAGLALTEAQRDEQSARDKETARHNAETEKTAARNATANELRARRQPAASAGLSSPTAEIAFNTHPYRVAQDLAYGKMTFSMFRTLLAYNRDANLKMAIYAKAAELNPNFNPAKFEMGFTLAKNPKVQQQLASLDNSIQGVSDLLKASDAASSTGLRVLNEYAPKGGLTIGGKKYSNFRVAQKAFADELSGALGFGSATDMSRQMGIDMTDPTLSPDRFSAAITDIVVPFINRKRSTLLYQMGTYGTEDFNPAASAPKTPPGMGGGESKTPPAAGGIQVGTRRLFNGQPAEWDGNGWKAVGAQTPQAQAPQAPPPKSTGYTVGQIKVFPNGKKGQWDGKGWVEIQ
jgi:hypothetical protein